MRWCLIELRDVDGETRVLRCVVEWQRKNVGWSDYREHCGCGVAKRCW